MKSILNVNFIAVLCALLAVVSAQSNSVTTSTTSTSSESGGGGAGKVTSSNGGGGNNTSQGLSCSETNGKQVCEASKNGQKKKFNSTQEAQTFLKAK
jgi:hypothetical protein